MHNFFDFNISGRMGKGALSRAHQRQTILKMGTVDPPLPILQICFVIFDIYLGALTI